MALYKVDVLKAFCWKIRCSPKLKHFLWQLVTGCIGVRKNLQARGIQGDICCARCGAPEESINHVFFECPPALQVWALSKIPSNPTIFPTSSLFTNMDHLFWRVLPQMEDHQFVWILWYIWKARNNKVFSNLDMDPMDTLKLAETESTLWAEAQVVNDQRMPPPIIDMILPSIPGRWCFTDGSWKEGVTFSGQGWLSTLEGFNGLLGARNVRASLSPLHAEMEALLWAMEWVHQTYFPELQTSELLRESALEREEKKSNSLTCTDWILIWETNLKMMRTPMEPTTFHNTHCEQLDLLALITAPTFMVIDWESEHRLWQLTTLRSNQDS
ncbi:PREDICTED: uncharacterized protein LOC106308810 [Brassica oleracea var. oleracea]|uniref:uncharacterized protein LOC106308810 n=1 Tax=Brassica oleracea var. oleracea TaxID=109376 RepID=UPI0006A6F2B9|nr:PREDICTED: uncharacterized protein LOC106308810 [Brassica oleracea var. oleracea]